MRQKFSERYGFTKPRDAFQLNSIDDGLRNRIWNTVEKIYFDTIPLQDSGDIYGKVYVKLKVDYIFFARVYDEFFKFHTKPSHTLYTLKDEIKKYFLKAPWYEIYDFVEFISQIYHDQGVNQDFRILINQVLEEEKSGYRFVEDLIAPIIDNVEIDEIEEAMDAQLDGVKLHLSKALELLSDRQNPDYTNSIKESISAVETALNKLNNTGNVALNRAIEKIKFDIDNNLKQGFIKLYSWTSSADGIRHGVTGNEIKSTFEEAKYMLVTCSAFVNYLIGKSK